MGSLRAWLQALELIRELTKHFPIARARMRVKLVLALSKKPTILERLSAWGATTESEEETNDLFSVVRLSLLHASLPVQDGI